MIDLYDSVTYRDTRFGFREEGDQNETGVVRNMVIRNGNN